MELDQEATRRRIGPPGLERQEDVALDFSINMWRLALHDYWLKKGGRWPGQTNATWLRHRPEPDH